MVSEVPLNFSVIPETVPSRLEARAMQKGPFPEQWVSLIKDRSMNWIRLRGLVFQLRKNKKQIVGTDLTLNPIFVNREYSLSISETEPDLKPLTHSTNVETWLSKFQLFDSFKDTG